jgi:HPt (histidine-containing phosphotransfer) domain-containing protein
LDLPILDCERLKLITRGRSALAGEFMAGLIDEAGGLIERLSPMAGGTNVTGVSDIAHTIKGMAAELGAMRLCAAAATLEAETQPARWPLLIERLRAEVTELNALDI